MKSSSPHDRPLLVLDLDETLMYATMFQLEQPPDFRIGLANVVKRPGVEPFLAACLDLFHVGIWTSATAEYAEDALSHLLSEASEKLVFIRTRQHCAQVFDPQTQERYWHKDLGQLLNDGYDPRAIIVVDDTPESWTPYEDNVVPVTKYRGDPRDAELGLLLRYLIRLSRAADVRAVDKRRGLSLLRPSSELPLPTENSPSREKFFVNAQSDLEIFELRI